MAKLPLNKEGYDFSFSDMGLRIVFIYLDPSNLF